MDQPDDTEFLMRADAYARETGCDAHDAGLMVSLKDMIERGDTLIAGRVRPRVAKAIGSYLVPRVAAIYGRGQLYTAASLFARSGRPKDELRLWSAVSSADEFRSIHRWMAELGEYCDG